MPVHLDKFQAGKNFVAGEYRGEADKAVDQAESGAMSEQRELLSQKYLNEAAYGFKNNEGGGKTAREEELTCA